MTYLALVIGFVLGCIWNRPRRNVSVRYDDFGGYESRSQMMERVTTEELSEQERGLLEWMARNN